MFVYDEDYKNTVLYKSSPISGGSLKGDTSSRVKNISQSLNKQNSNFLQKLGFKLVKKKK